MDIRRGALDSLLNGLPYFVIGAAIGAAGGLLLALEPGCQTRGRLARWLTDRREKGRERLHAGREHVEAALEAGREAYATGKEVYHKTLGET